MENIGFVIGNGESRKGFDLHLLRGRGPTIGCNALYRDFSPDYLFVRDRSMIVEVNRSYKGKVVLCKPGETEVELEGKIIEFPKTLAMAGTLAIHTLCSLRPDLEQVYLLGFDPFPSEGKVNNVYKGTKNYPSKNSRFFVQKNIKEYIIRVLNLHRNSFCRVGGLKDELPTSWTEKMRCINYEQFQKEIFHVSN